MKLFYLTNFLFFISKVFCDSGFITYYNDDNITACGFNSDQFSELAQVSISSFDWGNSLACGTCLLINGTGIGSGDTPFAGSYQAIVTNVCDVCEKGVFSLHGEGDGKWEIEYSLVPCKNGPIKYKLSNSNDYYIRLQIINTPYTISELYIENKLCVRTPDNFWIQLGSTKYVYPLHIKFKTTDGTEYNGLIYNKTDFTKLKLDNLRKHV